ncbi:hypothetical protein EGW08_002303 [Elysia chlorotica]|uniref:C2 domain-containing protein n=1 Tax=Elysia chlorotica TaxID=188477 RepID=A0A3S0ZYP7_ELYCH|nr:hypothetical protein EGW08_002303 [Elysia chlorotica]
MSGVQGEEECPLVKNPLNLPTYQRRLRHLHGIAVRNLQLPKNQTVDFSKLQVYFTLHKDGKGKALYRSEKITGSLNPTWQSFDLTKCDLDVDLTTRYVVVRIWISHGGDAAKVKIEADVHLSGLVFFADKLQVAGVNHQANTLLFGMFAGYFIHFNKAVTNSQLSDWLLDKAVPSASRPAATIVDQGLLRPSYNTNSLSRIHTVQRAIKQTHASVRRIHSQLEDKILSSSEHSERLSNREVLLMKVRQLRHELLWQTQKRQSEQEALESFKALQDAKLLDIKEKKERLQNLCKETKENRSMHIQSKEMLVKENAQVLFRRKQIISEMVNLIYPITEDQKENFYICKVKLPNAENYQGQDETRLSVALGFTCHLVQMVSHFMDMPLRYPMVHRGSRSVIIDHIHSKLLEKDRDFPLYGKGKEKFQYNYAVFLLNKNISQLRFYCGLGTNDLRQTLPNLKSLFVQRLGVRNSSTPPGEVQRREEPGRRKAPPPLTGPDSLYTQSRHSSNSGGGAEQGQGQGHAAGQRLGAWAASLSTPDLEGVGGGGAGNARSISSLRSGSSGGGHSSVGAPMVEGFDLTSLNGGVSHDRNSSSVIVKPLLPDGLERRVNSSPSPWYHNGNSLSHHNGAEDTTAPVEFSRFFEDATVMQQDQPAIAEEEEEEEGAGENENDDLFQPSAEDTFFQVKRKQALDDLNSALDGVANHEALLPSLREQVLGNGLLEGSNLPMVSASPTSPESRTFKLVKTAAQASRVLSPGSSQDFSGEEEDEEETTETKSTSSTSPKSMAELVSSPEQENNTNGELVEKRLSFAKSPGCSPSSTSPPVQTSACEASLTDAPSDVQDSNSISGSAAL